MRKSWDFSAINLRYEGLKYFKLYKWQNRLAKMCNFLSKLFELWNFEFFQFASKTKKVCKKVKIFQQSIRAAKIWKIPSYINDRIGSQKSVVFSASYWSFESLKYNKLFHRIIAFVKVLNFSSKLVSSES